MSHVRKLELSGTVCNRIPTQRVSSYYSWPNGEKLSRVEDIIKGYKKAFCNVNIKITHNYID